MPTLMDECLYEDYETPPPTNVEVADIDDASTGEFAPASVSTEVFPELTPREREVAMRLSIGGTNRQIAEALGISIKTVDTHRGHLLRKLACKNNVHLARLAIRAGYLSA